MAVEQGPNTKRAATPLHVVQAHCRNNCTRCPRQSCVCCMHGQASVMVAAVRRGAAQGVTSARCLCGSDARLGGVGCRHLTCRTSAHHRGRRAGGFVPTVPSPWERVPTFDGDSFPSLNQWLTLTLKAVPTVPNALWVTPSPMRMANWCGSSWRVCGAGSLDRG